MSITIMNWIWTEEKQTHGEERLVLLALGDQANDEGFTWPSVDTIARKANTAPRSVPRLAHKLILKDLLTVRSRFVGERRTSNMYRVVYTPQIAAEERAQGRLGVSPYTEMGDSVTPLENAGGGDRVAPQGGQSGTPGVSEGQGGGDRVTPESLINPLLSTNEPSGNPPTGDQIRDWNIILEQLRPRCDQRFYRTVSQLELIRVRLGVYVVAGPDPELMQARLEAIINRMLTGFEPGARVEFVQA